jgi:hypothetical protein
MKRDRGATMQPDLSLSPRQAWLAGLGGGALAGLAVLVKAIRHVLFDLNRLET